MSSLKPAGEMLIATGNYLPRQDWINGLPGRFRLQPAFAYLGYRQGAFPQAEEASRQVLALPVFPQMKEEQQMIVVDAIAAFFAAKG
jgi:dTDP-4-amino-4,6-dideoxygalactose transaminase